MMRDKLKNRAKKAQKRQQRNREAEEAAAWLIPAIKEASDAKLLESLEEVLAAAQRWAGLVEALDGEVVRGQERLGQLRVEAQAARKAATIEVSLHVAGSAHIPALSEHLASCRNISITAKRSKWSMCRVSRLQHPQWSHPAFCCAQSPVI